MAAIRCGFDALVSTPIAVTERRLDLGQCGRCDALDSRGLREGARPSSFKLASYLIGQAIKATILKIRRDFLCFIALQRFDIPFLPIKVLCI
mgnify:CR=1 FL=1